MDLTFEDPLRGYMTHAMALGNITLA